MKNIPIITGWMLAVSLIVAAQAAEKGGTADINIGVGELQQQRTPPARQPGQSVPKTKPNMPNQVQNNQKPSKTGLLLPAVQKAREAANNNQGKSKPLTSHEATHAMQSKPTTPVQPSEVKQPGKEQETGLLLPAVQNAREPVSTNQGSSVPPDQVKKSGEEEQAGLLLPAVQKAREAANHNAPSLPANGATAPAGGFAPQPLAGNTASKSKSKSKAGKVEYEWKVEEGEK